MPDRLEQMLLHRPTMTNAKLPKEAPNRPLHVDPLGDAIDMILGGVGINNPLAKDASMATRTGAMATAGTPLLSKAFQIMRARDAAIAARGMAEVPAELQGFRPTAHEFNPVAPRDPAAGLTPEEAAKMRKLISGGGEPGAVGTSGSKPSQGVGGTGPQPPAKASIPSYRSKAGIAADTLDDMKKVTTPSQIGGDPISHLDRFEYKLSTNPKNHSPVGFDRTMGYEGPSGPDLTTEQVTALLSNPARLDESHPFTVSEDPTQYIARLKGIDDMAGFKTPEHKALEIEHTGAPIPHPQMINKLIQDLSDYFSGPKFDPFLGGGPEK